MRHHKAKIHCSLGPTTDDESVLRAMVEAGMGGARINLSFDDLETQSSRIRMVRHVARTVGRDVAVVVDLPGRKVRVGDLLDAECTLVSGERVCFQQDAAPPPEAGLSVLPVDAGFFHENLAIGDRILLSDSQVEVELRETGSGHAVGEVLLGGKVRRRSVIHVPGMVPESPALSEADRAGLAMAHAHDADFVAPSFLSEGKDLIELREALADLNSHTPAIFKVERAEAFARIDGILERADGIMLRRGDLGSAIELARMPFVQKQIIRLANERGVPIIIATQMLGSMQHAPTPTRAEASDLSNSVVDGADGVLLSAETAIGRFPVEAVKMAARIIEETEGSHGQPRRERQRETYPSPFADITAEMACRAAHETGAVAIACFTESGRTARLLAKHRPTVPIVAFCPHERTRRQMALHWSVRSDALDVIPDVDDMVQAVDKRLQSQGKVKPGDPIVIVFGAPVGQMGHTNSVRIHTVGEIG